MGVALSPNALRHHSPRMLCSGVNPMLEAAIQCREATQHRTASSSSLSRSTSHTPMGSPSARTPTTPPVYRRFHSHMGAAGSPGGSGCRFSSPSSPRALSRSTSTLSPLMQRRGMTGSPRWNSSTKINSPTTPTLKPQLLLGPRSPLRIVKSRADPHTAAATAAATFSASSPPMVLRTPSMRSDDVERSVTALLPCRLERKKQ